MPKRKKGKVTVVQRSQLQTIYTPVIRIRRHTLSRFKTQLVLDAFLMNEQLIWERTSNCKIISQESGSFIRLLRRERATDISGKRLSSIRYDTVIEAENAAFDYRYSLESKKSKKTWMNINQIFYYDFQVQLYLAQLHILLLHFHQESNQNAISMQCHLIFP